MAGHPNLLKLQKYEKAKNTKISPSQIIKVNYRGPGDYTLEQVYMNVGDMMSASTVAAAFGDYIFTGNLMDNKFLLLQRSEKR